MLESAVVTINCRTVSVSVIALILGLSVSGSPFQAAAQAKPGVSPGDITVVQFAYKGQKYEIPRGAEVRLLEARVERRARG
jgi:hypothetical protein